MRLSLSKYRLLTLSIVIGVTTTTPSCKPRSKSSEVLAVDVSDGLTLDDFQYETSDIVFRELSARVGCRDATRWAVSPKEPFSKLIAELKRQKVPYEYLEEKLFFAESDAAKCSGNQNKSNLDGVKALHALVTSKGYGLTVVMVGGLGSHLTKDGALALSRRSWDTAMPKDSFREARVECTPNSYATDDICAPTVEAKIMELIASEGPKEHLYLIWGYSKGGTTMTQILASSQVIRDKMIALITLGAPFGGGLPMRVVSPLIDQIASQYRTMPLRDQLVVQGLLMAGAGYAGTMEQMKSTAGFVQIFESSNLPVVKEGVKSLLPGRREEFLKNTSAKWDLRRSKPNPLNGSMTTSIFHVSGTVDIARLKVLPDLEIGAGKLITPKFETMRPTHLGELALVSELSQHPLSDMCVALEHSVIPKFALPKGTSTELLAVLHLDHMSLGFSENPSAENPPGEAIVDSIMDAITQKMRKTP